jgi:hypothetical protein
MIFLFCRWMRFDWFQNVNNLTSYSYNSLIATNFSQNLKKITKCLICRFSGLTAEDLHGVRTRLRDVQAVLLMKFKASDILIGHSLESDLKALKVGNMGINLQSTFFYENWDRFIFIFMDSDHSLRILHCSLDFELNQKSAKVCGS